MNNYNSSRPEMNSNEYKSWRYSVFSRDGWLCQMCFTKGKELEAHHIVKWSVNPKLRFLRDNGLTLCENCHDQVTGHEEKYELKFKAIVAQKKFERKLKVPKKDKMTGNKFKYKMLNPRWFF